MLDANKKMCRKCRVFYCTHSRMWSSSVAYCAICAVNVSVSSHRLHLPAPPADSAFYQQTESGSGHISGAFRVISQDGTVRCKACNFWNDKKGVEFDPECVIPSVSSVAAPGYRWYVLLEQMPQSNLPNLRPSVLQNWAHDNQPRCFTHRLQFLKFGTAHLNMNLCAVFGCEMTVRGTLFPLLPAAVPDLASLPAGVGRGGWAVWRLRYLHNKEERWERQICGIDGQCVLCDKRKVNVRCSCSLFTVCFLLTVQTDLEEASALCFGWTATHALPVVLKPT